jgi:hypothetical protein
MVEKVFVNSENLAEIVCPQCRKVWRKTLTELTVCKKRIIIKCKCPCGHSFPVSFERRRYPRKATDLGGAFIHDKRKSRGVIRVKNISLGGVGFELTGNYLLSSGDIVLLRFNLDDGLCTLISKEATIKKIIDNYVGSEFLGAIWKHDLLHLYLREE